MHAGIATSVAAGLASVLGASTVPGEFFPRPGRVRRLDALVGAGVMERRRYSQAPEQFEYLLTEMGRDLSPTLVALTLWGDQWATASEPPILYTHEVCGGPVQSRLDCGRCGEVSADGVRAQAGPGMPEGYVESRRARREPRPSST